MGYLRVKPPPAPARMRQRSVTMPASPPPSSSPPPASATASDSPTPPGDDVPPKPHETVPRSAPPSRANATTPPASKKSKSMATANAESGASTTVKVTKRRAARACTSCRARKVRCDVVEQFPCNNCKWDRVDCFVEENRRRKKHLYSAASGTAHPSGNTGGSLAQSIVNLHRPVNITSADELRRPSAVSMASTMESCAGGVMDAPVSLPHQMCTGPDFQTAGPMRTGVTGPPSIWPGTGHVGGHVPLQWLWPNLAPLGVWPQPQALFGNLPTAPLPGAVVEEPFVHLPPFIKPLNPKLQRRDIQYLDERGALTLTTPALQNALLRAYVEWVHPLMPLLELHWFLNAIHRGDGMAGRISLHLYQAVMFVSSAFVDIEHLHAAGFPDRRAARKFFFVKTRLLYDFDCEVDRLVKLQALLLMTFWYETPDDEKDTWHWMGAAISLAYMVGLHRNPTNPTTPLHIQRLRKRIWWSCFVRDRQIALGMRRPTRILDEQFDVPMLQGADFEIEALAEDNNLLGPDCIVIRDVDIQQQLAAMCIEMAKLCLCTSRMLKEQSSLLAQEPLQDDMTESTKGALDTVEGVHMVDGALMSWLASLPPCCQHRRLTANDLKIGNDVLAVHRSLLHMVYNTAVSALHRPVVLPPPKPHTPKVSAQAQEMSGIRVRNAASTITEIVADLERMNLQRFLPTTGVTVLLPALMIQLLDMKSVNTEARNKAMSNWRHCMRAMQRLRETYAAADFATVFLNAVLCQARVEIDNQQDEHEPQRHHHDGVVDEQLNVMLAPDPNNMAQAHVDEFEQWVQMPPESGSPGSSSPG